MHDSALATGRAFFERYVVAPSPRVLEVGARDVNGSLRGVAPESARYVGVDLEGGPGVDRVLDDPYVLPFEDAAFDAVVSTSCFEHTPFFWLAFVEQVRVLAPGGHLYASAPSNGWYHGYPFDHWRFYPDAGLALEAWARRSGQELTLVESFVGAQSGSIWNDFIMVFERSDTAAPRTSFVVEAFPDATNVRRFDREGLQNLHVQTEDERKIADLEMKNFVLGKRLREARTP